MDRIESSGRAWYNIGGYPSRSGGMADTRDLKSLARQGVCVRVASSAPGKAQHGRGERACCAFFSLKRISQKISQGRKYIFLPFCYDIHAAMGLIALRQVGGLGCLGRAKPWRIGEKGYATYKRPVFFCFSLYSSAIKGGTVT